MKKFLLLFILLGSFAKAESIGGVGLLIEDDDDDVQLTKTPPQKTQLTVSPVPVPAVRPVPVVPASSTAKSTGVPFQATLGQGKCPDVIPHPDAKNTPVKVYVDQQSQKVVIQTPEQVYHSKVSTGGGLKIPNGELKKGPYCARTPKKEKLIVSAVTEDMFAGTGCTPDEIRSKSTVFSTYFTRTFTDSEGKPLPMPHAVRISGGIFFHEVPGAYANLLGYNVSGECVRLPPQMAKTLEGLIKKYGAIEVNITDPPEVNPRAPNYCDDRMVARATEDQKYGSVSGPGVGPRPTGTEGVYGGTQSFLDGVVKIFKGFQPQQPGRSRI